MRRRRYSADQWAAWFEEFQNSDLTVAQFCERKGVSSNSFYQWRRRLSEPAVPKFVPVEVTNSSLVEIELPGGTTIRVPDDDASLGAVLRTLCSLGVQR